MDRGCETKTHMIDLVVKELSKSVNVVILCRYEDQLKEYAERYEGQAHVIRHVIDGISLISFADVFIGAGGTMTAEAALLGKPTISIAPVRYYVEKYLTSIGLVQRASSSKHILQLAKKMILDKNYVERQEKKAMHIIKSMDDPVDKILSFLTLQK